MGLKHSHKNKKSSFEDLLPIGDSPVHIDYSNIFAKYAM